MPQLIETEFASGTATTTLFSVTFAVGENPNNTVVYVDTTTNVQNNWGSSSVYQLYWDGNSVLTATRLGGLFESSVFAGVVNNNVWSYQITPGVGQPGGNSVTDIALLQTSDSDEPTVG